jgi:hypothetical protein
MNSTLYSFKGGSLWKHNSNSTYGHIYGNAPLSVTSGTDTAGTANKLTDSTATFDNGSVLVDDTVVNTDTGNYAVVTAIDSATVISLDRDIFSSSNNYKIQRNLTEIKTTFNQAPNDQKVFKTIELESTAAWDVDASTDMSNGTIDKEWFSLKEGDYYAYIRKDLNDTDATSLAYQGVGTLDAWDGGTLTLTFGFFLSTSISVGDKIYRINGGALELIGTVTAHTSYTVTVDAAAVTPAGGDKIVVVKNTQAESSGIRGYEMTVQLTTDSTSVVELFSISSDTFKSNP